MSVTDKAKLGVLEAIRNSLQKQGLLDYEPPRRTNIAEQNDVEQSALNGVLDAKVSPNSMFPELAGQPLRAAVNPEILSQSAKRAPLYAALDSEPYIDPYFINKKKDKDGNWVGNSQNIAAGMRRTAKTPIQQATREAVTASPVLMQEAAAYRAMPVPVQKTDRARAIRNAMQSRGLL